MKEFWQVLVKYVKPYNGYLGGAVVLNILSAVLNIFSFSLIIPILQILFKMDTTVYTFIPWDSTDASFKEIVINNAYYGVTMLIQDKGASVTLLLMCLWLGIMTFFKTSCYFGASAIMIPIRTSVVRDMRRELYNKILTLPLGFFSQERKGDIIARMSGDIGEVENSIMSTLDMLLKNPILIIFYIGTLIITSWQLTVFTILVAPLLIWLMSALGRTLKKRSLQAQALWSDTMSQLEETLGGLRVIKAFVAEDKMQNRFDNVTEAVKKKDRQSRYKTGTCTSYERIPRHSPDYDCVMVRRNHHPQRKSLVRRSYIHILHGDTVQRHQSVERLRQGRLQYP